MPSLYPMMSAPEDFQVGDCVRKFYSEKSVTPFCGVVTHITPRTYKVWVQWPIEHSQESPETLVKVNPAIFGMPTVHTDMGYSSYEKTLSEKMRGALPKRRASEGMSIRVAHTFATSVVGKLVKEIGVCHKEKLSDVKTYNRVFAKYENICSDYIIRSSIRRVYSSYEQKESESVPS